MRILAMTDVHGSKHALDFISQFASRYEPDILCIAGDISHFGPVEWAGELMDQIDNQIGVPCLTVPGNCDPPETVEAIKESRVTGLHLKSEEVGGIKFVGLGGSSTTPFPTLFEWEDDYAMQIDGLLDDSSVLLSHNPPLGCLDSTHFVKNVGSKSLREMVDRRQPRLVICGHIHEARGIAELGRTRLVNPGMLAKGFAAVIDMEAKPVSPVKIEMDSISLK
jgi:Icc-related predicted phosphoesterase